MASVTSAGAGAQASQLISPGQLVDEMDTSRLQDTIFESERVRALSVVVVGAGALGNEVVKNLGLLGVRRILIVDPDIVEPSNLTRSIFFRGPNCGGLNKAEALAKTAGKIFPETEFLICPREIADTGANLLVQADLIFSCVDSDLARLEIAYISTAFQVPVAEGGLGGSRYSHGRFTWFAGREGACYCCKLPAQRRRELLTLWQAVPFSCAAPADDPVRPSTPTMSGIVGSMQVELGLRNFLSGAVVSESVEISFDAVPALQVFKNSQASQCPFHGQRKDRRVYAGHFSAEQVLRREEIADLNDPYVHLDWPVCTRARCNGCGHRWAPMVRLGLLQRRAFCPACGSNHILSTQNIQTLKIGDACSAYPLSALGIPPDHLVSVRAN